jgi:LysR family transcriptional regulator, benzoate and cis,cis-muconate-responsive activator of ben and cat genes
MVEGMELRHLKYFVAVAEEQNVTRAAARLHVSQPPLSRQIRDLEEELGVALFEHTARSVRLTAAGKVFLTEAQAVLRRAEEAVQTVKAAVGEGGEINVAYAPSLTVQILPGTLRLFQGESPAVRVNLHDLSTEEMLEGLREGTLDVALMIHPGQKNLRGLLFEELYCYPLCLAAHPAHPLARGRQVKLQQILSERLIAYSKAGYPEYYERLASVFKPLGRMPRVAEEHDSSTSLIAAVEAGRGVALVPASLGCLAGPRLKLRSLTPAPEALVVGLARRKGPASTVVERFIAAARACRGESAPLMSGSTRRVARR